MSERRCRVNALVPMLGYDCYLWHRRKYALGIVKAKQLPKAGQCGTDVLTILAVMAFRTLDQSSSSLVATLAATLSSFATSIAST